MAADSAVAGLSFQCFEFGAELVNAIEQRSRDIMSVQEFHTGLVFSLIKVPTQIAPLFRLLLNSVIDRIGGRRGGSRLSRPFRVRLRLLLTLLPQQRFIFFVVQRRNTLRIGERRQAAETTRQHDIAPDTTRRYVADLLDAMGVTPDVELGARCSRQGKNRYCCRQ